MDHDKIREATRLLLEAIGENPDREGLLDTPGRVARMCEELYSGIGQDPANLMEAVFTVDYSEIVLVRDIEFHSMCEHHLLPFVGKAHVAYLPKGKVVGISKLARVVDAYARRPQVQERLTNQVADLIMDHLQPASVAVIIEASHQCMTIRGVRKPGSSVITSALRGGFLDDPASRGEIMSLLHDQVR